MAIGTGTVKLSEIITEFGGSTSTPNNLRAYLKCGNFLGWDGGVANHENNANVPFSGTVNLGNFRSAGDLIVDRDFESDNYTGQLTFWVSGDYSFYESKSGLCTSAASSALSLGFSGATNGTKGTIDVIGKSTYDTSPGYTELATVNSVFDYSFGINPYPDTAVFALTGDQRATGWGSPWKSVTVTINNSPSSLNRVDSVVPNGSYNVPNNITYWVWNNIFGFVNGDFTPYNFKCSVSVI